MRRDLLDALPPGVFDVRTGLLHGDRLVASAVRVVLDQDSGLDLSSVTRWYMHEDYAAALAEVSKVVGRRIARTETEDGTGVAMVLHEPDGEHVLLPVWLLVGVFSADENESALCINTVHHELSHVHDGAVHRRNLPGFFDGSLRVGGWKSAWLFPFAHDIWSEYYADRRSHPTRRNGEAFHMSLLESAVRRFPGVVGAAFRNLNDDSDMDEAYAQAEPILSEVGSHLEFLCKHLGYVMGTLAASRSGPGEPSSPPAVAAVPWLQDGWANLEQHLDSMYRNHGHWSGIEMFNPLQTVVESMLAKVGMKLTTVFGRPLVLPAA